MNAEAWIALGALVLNLLMLAVGYGVLKGAVTALDARVKALEAEMSAVTTLMADVARIDERTKALKEGMDRLLGSWLLQDPPGYTPAGVTPPTPRRPR